MWRFMIVDSHIFKYCNCSHVLCNVHLLRELLYVVENTGQGWAVWMMDFLRRLKLVVERYKAEEVGCCQSVVVRVLRSISGF